MCQGHVAHACISRIDSRICSRNSRLHSSSACETATRVRIRVVQRVHKRRLDHKVRPPRVRPDLGCRYHELLSMAVLEILEGA